MAISRWIQNKSDFKFDRNDEEQNRFSYQEPEAVTSNRMSLNFNVFVRLLCVACEQNLHRHHLGLDRTYIHTTL